MPLEPGTTLGPYEILSPIGAGGMGEVYKARDTRLNRTVAIKVLPEHVASDPDLKQRFEREAKTISSLNHPHICTLFDIGEQDGIDFLVMEYLEGDTLAQRLEKGALPLDQALKIAVEIADALAKAHRQGITHRDLKPGNIMLTKAGAKLLDFGLAKLKPGHDVPVGVSAPTVSAGLTGEGTILGTLQYMAPEQLEGKEADARTDIFAFGAVCYEMVTGQKAFTGDSQASLIAAILDREPVPMSTLQSMTPARLDEIVKTCLAKDPDERWQSAGDLGRQVKGIIEGESQPRVPFPLTGAPQRVSWQHAIPLALATLTVGSVVTGLTVWNVRSVTPRPLARFAITEVPFTRHGGHDIAISPDGTNIVYIDGEQLLVRALDTFAATPIQGLSYPQSPFVSPDSASVGFYAGGELKRVPILGGPAITICRVARSGIGSSDGRNIQAVGASWGPDDVIIFGTSAPSGLWRCPASGGEPEELTRPNPEQGELNHMWPEILPGGQAVLFTIIPSGPVENAQIALLILETGAQRILVSGGSHPHFAPTGHLVYGVSGTLRAVGFDLDRLEVTTDPILVQDGVITETGGAAEFSFSDDGTLVYLSGTGNSGRSIVWVDRQGNEEALPGLDVDAYLGVRISPDGAHLAIHIAGSETGNEDVWTYDIARETLSKLTTDQGLDGTPLWTLDGERVVFASNRGGQWSLFWRQADGTGEAERLLTREGVARLVPFAWSADGTKLVFMETNPDTGTDLGILSMDGDRPAEWLIQTESNEGFASVSHDGRWIAYASDRSGDWQIHVDRFPDLGDHKQISTDGALYPLWSHDGREIFYYSRLGRQLLAVPIETHLQQSGRGQEFMPGTPAVLFEGPFYTATPRPYDITPDGQRFIMVKWAATINPSELRLVQNWFGELQRLVPTP